MSITVRAFNIDDREAVFSLYGQVFGLEALELFRRRWEWQFERNPAAEFAPSLIWLAEKGDEIVGHLASFPQRMKLLDSEVIVYHDCDLLVSPSARRQGVGRLLVEAYDNSPNQLSNCLASFPANGRIRGRLGYRPAHLIPRCLRPINTLAITDYLLASERMPWMLRTPPTSWVLRTLGLGLGVATAIANTLRDPQPSREYRSEKITEVGAEFDGLWAEVSAQIPSLAVRDRHFVKWRFVDDPVFDNTLFVARDLSGTLAGYVAIRTWKRREMVEGRIMDLFCRPESTAIVESLLHSALQHLREEDADLVSCWGLHPSIRNAVRRHLYVAPSSLDHPSWLLWKGSREIESVVYNPDSWHLSCADSDLGFNS